MNMHTFVCYKFCFSICFCHKTALQDGEKGESEEKGGRRRRRRKKMKTRKR
jgi:hypothetical protein